MSYFSFSLTHIQCRRRKGSRDDISQVIGPQHINRMRCDEMTYWKKSLGCRLLLNKNKHLNRCDLHRMDVMIFSVQNSRSTECVRCAPVKNITKTQKINSNNNMLLLPNNNNISAVKNLFAYDLRGANGYVCRYAHTHTHTYARRWIKKKRNDCVRYKYQMVNERVKMCNAKRTAQKI